MRRFMYVLPFILAASQAFAEAPAPVALDLPGVAKTAAERSLEVKSSLQGVESAKSTLRRAEGYRGGRLGLGARVLHFDAPIQTVSPSITSSILGHTVTITPPPVTVSPQDVIHLAVEGGYPIYTGGRIEYAVKGAEHGVAAMEALAADTRAGAVQQSVNLYLAVLFAREVVRVQEQALQSYREHLAQADKLYKSGVVAKYDLIRAETAVKEQERRLEEARNRVELAVAALKTSLSLGEDAPVSITGSLFEADVPESLLAAQNAAVKTNPVLLALGEQVKALGMAVEAERADGRPLVTGIARAELLKGALAQTDPNWVVGVEASLNIFDGGVRNARISEKEWQLRQAETERQRITDQIRLGVQSALLEIESAKTALQAARKSRELAEEGLRLAMRRFEVGAGTSLEVLDAGVAREAAQVGEYQTLYQLDTAYFKLHRYINDIEKVSEEAGK